MFREKLKAALIHAGFTLVIALLTATVVFKVWFPNELAEMAKGTGLFTLVLAVEITLGPLVSLVIYNSAKPKKELITDYMIVGAIQLAALSYGVFSVMESRPIYLVFVKDRLEVVAAVELKKEDLSDASGRFKSLSYFGPELICTTSPESEEEKSELIFSGITGKDIQLYPKYYRDCVEGEVIEGAYKKEQFESVSLLKLDMLPETIQEQDFVWMPVLTRFGAWIAVYIDGEINQVQYFNLNPFDGSSEG